MIEHVMSRMGGVSVYGVISICLFFALFFGVLLWAACLKKGYLTAMGRLPLEGETTHPTNINPAPENSHESTR
jgi:hypothetical protein